MVQERIRALSPGALRIFKQQAFERARAGDPTYARIVSMPELSDIFPQGITPQPTTRQPQIGQEAPQQIPWWQHPLNFIRGVETGFGALVTAPFTPSVPGTEGLSFFEREKLEYKAWDEPSFQVDPLFRLPWTSKEERERPWTIGIKGAIETVPWFATAIATGGLSAAGVLGARVGATGITRAAQAGLRVLKPIRTAEAVAAAAPFKVAGKILAPVTKPLAKAAKGIAKKVVDTSVRLVPDLQPIGEAISIAADPTKLRKLVNITTPSIKVLGKTIGGKQPLRGIAEIVGGMAAVADNPALLALTGRNVLRFEGANKALASVATLNRMGSSKTVFNLTNDGFMRIGGKDVHINTVRTFPKRYETQLTTRQKEWITQAQLLEGEKRELFKRAGIKISDLTFEEGGIYAGRRVVGRFEGNELVDVAYVGARQPTRVGAKSAQEKVRSYANIEDAIKDKFRYLPEEEALYHNIVNAYNRVANKQFSEWFLKLVPHETLKGKARVTRFGEVQAPDIPAFAGKVFTSPEAKEYINIIRKELNPQSNQALSAINQVNAVGRYFALAGDASPFSIQLIFFAGSQPRIFGRAVGGFVKAMFDPLYHDNLISKHLGTIQKHRGMVITRGGSTEMTEAMARGGLLRKQPFKLFGKALEPFQRGFEGALDTAGIYMAESLDHLATTPMRTAQVDAFINEFRGLLSTTRIGISSGQRQIERTIVLAPQYNRAVGALLWDIGQGNLRGQLAREHMAKGVTAIMAMTVAVSYAMGESQEEIIDHLNPRSSNFMTWDIAGQRIGPGSKVRSLLATFGKITKNPEDAAFHAGRFLKGNFSPFLGTSIDLITGKDFLGDPTRDGLLSLTETVIGNNLLPIWVQSVAFEGGELNERVTRGLAEFGGLRAYPAGAFADLKDKQDELARQQFGVSWDELGQQPNGFTEQIRLSQTQELKDLEDKAELESAKFARGDQLEWNKYGREVDRIGNMVTNELNQADRQFVATRDGSQLRDRVNQAYWMKSQMMRDILKKDEFAIVRDSFGRELSPEARAQMEPQKLLYRDYNELMYASDMFTEFGEYNFTEADRRRQMFIQMYGLDALNSVEQVIGERRADEPPSVKLLRQAQQILQPYWQIENQIWANLPQGFKEISEQIEILARTDPRGADLQLFRYPQIVFARKMIALRKRQMKATNQDIANALNMFYRF
ncbi:hypothetical protein LCGC14_0349820 [marine sediment metagenome]|uniref:Large polyvalent protein associated domain-containing protein n=1 Tax=marine sediment metagenome TaxID=412755 RepID=A0A0F9TB44_9ZZZZ